MPLRTYVSLIVSCLARPCASTFPAHRSTASKVDAWQKPRSVSGHSPTVPAILTQAEMTYHWRNRTALLVSYKAVSEVAGKAAVLAMLMLAARRLPTSDFG